MTSTRRIMESLSIHEVADDSSHGRSSGVGVIGVRPGKGDAFAPGTRTMPPMKSHLTPFDLVRQFPEECSR